MGYGASKKINIDQIIDQTVTDNDPNRIQVVRRTNLQIKGCGAKTFKE